MRSSATLEDRLHQPNLTTGSFLIPRQVSLCATRKSSFSRWVTGWVWLLDVCPEALGARRVARIKCPDKAKTHAGSDTQQDDFRATSCNRSPLAILVCCCCGRESCDVGAVVGWLQHGGAILGIDLSIHLRLLQFPLNLVSFGVHVALICTRLHCVSHSYAFVLSIIWILRYRSIFSF